MIRAVFSLLLLLARSELRAGGDPAETAFKELNARFEDRTADREKLQQDLLALRRTFPGTSPALRAAELLMRLPSPLDDLDPAKVIGDERRPKPPSELVAWLDEHHRAVASLAFSPDGRLLASASWDNSVRLWQFTGGSPKQRLVLEASPSSLAFAPDGATLATGGSSTTVHLWDVSADKAKETRVLAGHKNRPFALAFSPGGGLLASGCAAPVLRVWKRNGADIEAWAVLPTDEGSVVGIASLSFSADGKLLAAGNYAGKNSLRLWNVSGNIMEELELPPTRARLVLFSPAANLLALHGEGATIQLWDLAKPTRPTTQAALAGHPVRGVDSSVQALAFSPDGRLLASAGQDSKVVLWDVASAKKQHEWALGDQVKALAFAPDGRHLALGNADGSVFVLRLLRPKNL